MTHKGEHTQGPWIDGNEAIHTRVDRTCPWSGTVFRKGYDGTEEAALVAMSFGRSPEQASANARVMSAAPELLEALRLCAPYAAQVEARDADNAALDAWVAADAAIRKATGAQP